jgi:hypothetical protein
MKIFVLISVFFIFLSYIQAEPTCDQTTGLCIDLSDVTIKSGNVRYEGPWFTQRISLHHKGWVHEDGKIIERYEMLFTIRDAITGEETSAIIVSASQVEKIIEKFHYKDQKTILMDPTGETFSTSESRAIHQIVLTSEYREKIFGLEELNIPVPSSFKKYLIYFKYNNIM